MSPSTTPIESSSFCTKSARLLIRLPRNLVKLMTSEALRDFVLIVDKPVGPTSHDVVAQARRVLRTKRIGHTGTLDPFASGLLVLCVNRATRIAEYLTGLRKSYQAVARL